ncbi:hypothetical protein BHM03_00061441 [Ensete ventricosum]|nr:hypothetical protein BHM03_00061441 [Ensete ventricosum]
MLIGCSSRAGCSHSKDPHQRGPRQRVITTLREELRANEEDGARWERPLKGSINWRELFGIKKAQVQFSSLLINTTRLILFPFAS